MIWIIIAGLWVGFFAIDHWSRWAFFFLALAGMAYYFIAARNYYKGSCWRREYFPLIHHFSFLGGAHVAAADMVGQEYDPETAFSPLLKHRYPNWTDKEINDFIAKNRERFQSGFYKSEFFNVALAEKPDGDKEFLRILVDKQFEQAAALRVRSLLAEVIERECGSDQRKAFWKALIRGEVE